MRRASRLTAMGLLALTACSRSHPESPPAPRRREAPARTIAVRTGRFDLVASIYVDLAAGLPHGGSDPPPLFDLAACVDDACAMRAMGDFGPDFASRLPAARGRWVDEAQRARRAMQVGEAFLAPAEDAIAVRIGSDFALAWPEEPTVVLVTGIGAGTRDDAAASDAPIDASSRCFLGATVLVCAFERAVRAHADRSALLVALEDERKKLEPAARERTTELASALIAHGVTTAVREVFPGYDPLRAVRIESAHEPRVLDWLAREWPKRMHRELGAEAFGRKAAHEVAMLSEGP